MTSRVSPTHLVYVKAHFISAARGREAPRDSTASGIDWGRKGPNARVRLASGDR